MDNLIGQLLLNSGFKKVDSKEYVFALDDDVTFIVRLPQKSKGFLFACWFNEQGIYNGDFKNTLIRYCNHEHLLAFAELRKYSSDEVFNATKAFLDDIKIYISSGRVSIREHIDNWWIPEEKNRNTVEMYLGLKITDPYSDEYLNEQLKQLCHGGVMVISDAEYKEHKEYYEKYLEKGGKISYNRSTSNWKITFY